MADKKARKDRMKENPAVEPESTAAAAAAEDETPRPEPEQPGPMESQEAADERPPADAAEELQQLRERFLRLQADFDNYRKRVARDEVARARRATERLVEALLPTLDHFEMGLQAARNQNVAESVVAGLDLVRNQILDVLKKEGVKPVISEGTAFDPQCHECVVHMPSPDFAENMIIQETRKGYWLGDFLLRPAQVVVSSGPPAQATSAATAEGLEQDAVVDDD
ncbi:MAG: nucleotide exchange factor GrpE [Kiritimatiellia bacterium]|nr:nucleotide exchange factor GrpE [Lentisphaerota bacterium]